jgi:hypothetical protein
MLPLTATTFNAALPSRPEAADVLSEVALIALSLDVLDIVGTTGINGDVVPLSRRCCIDGLAFAGISDGHWAADQCPNHATSNASDQ